MAYIVYRTYKTCSATGYDKRLNIINLAIGTWLLRFISVADVNGKVHECAHTDTSKYSRLRNKLDTLASGKNFNPGENEELTLLANQAMADLAKRADVILMTNHVVTEHRSYAASEARVVLHDEGARSTKLGTISRLIFSRPYIGDGQTMEVGERKRHIIAGDLF
ncbi:MAG: hypothetical protein Q9180_009725 [Flavoplaca navasiana]